MCKLQHKNIVKFIDDFIHIEHSFCKTRYFYLIVMECYDNGDLVQFLDKYKEKKKHIKEEAILHILGQLCEAIAYIHKYNIVHRDIKLANVFLSKDNNVRLGDFGLSENIRRIRLGRVGTKAYMAPEEFDKLAEHSLEYKKAKDMWCVGCILYELCTGQLLVRLDFILGKKLADKPAFLTKFLSSIPSKYSKPFRNMIKRLLNPDPTKRLQAEEILKKSKVRKQQKVPSYKVFKNDLIDVS